MTKLEWQAADRDGTGRVHISTATKQIKLCELCGRAIGATAERPWGAKYLAVDHRFAHSQCVWALDDKE